MIRQRRRAPPLLGPSVLDGQFYCHPQTLPITGCLGKRHHQHDIGLNLGGIVEVAGV